MLTMDNINNIRDMYYRQGLTVAEICRNTKRDRKTINKYIDKTDFSPKPPKPANETAFCPKLDKFKPIIDAWLEEDKKAPRKQRHTARRVFNRLVKEENGFDCSYRIVARYVVIRKKETFFLPFTPSYLLLIFHMPL